MSALRGEWISGCLSTRFTGRAVSWLVEWLTTKGGGHAYERKAGLTVTSSSRRHHTEQTDTHHNDKYMAPRQESRREARILPLGSHRSKQGIIQRHPFAPTTAPHLKLSRRSCRPREARARPRAESSLRHGRHEDSLSIQSPGHTTTSSLPATFLHEEITVCTNTPRKEIRGMNTN